MNRIKLFVKKLIYKHKATSETYIQFLRSKGARIGEGVIIYSPKHTRIDRQFPFMLSIGNNVHITSGVRIINHDYSWSVIKATTGLVVGGGRPRT